MTPLIKLIEPETSNIYPLCIYNTGSSSVNSPGTDLLQPITGIIASRVIFGHWLTELVCISQ